VSLDYPNRAEWLAKRNNHVAGKRVYGRMLRVMRDSGKNKDPGLTHEHRRMKGELVPATGPGSIHERDEMFALIEAGKPQEAAEYYRRCLNINYRAGKPKLHRDMVTWYAYYN